MKQLTKALLAVALLGAMASSPVLGHGGGGGGGGHGGGGFGGGGGGHYGGCLLYTSDAADE